MRNLTVHGHNVRRLSGLIRDAWPGYEEDLTLEIRGSGWSNVNIVMVTDEPDFVLKLPGLNISYDKNPYDYIWNMHLEISSHGLCSRPIFKSRLDDDKSTPFVILEYVKGHIAANPNDLTEDQILHLKSALSRFSNLKPSGVNEILGASEFVESVMSRLNSLLDELPRSAQKVGRQCALFRARVKRFHDLYAYSGSWSLGLMHGDLQESNIVFSETAKMLDLESCAYGNSSYDAIYLYTQHPKSNELDLQNLLMDSQLQDEDAKMLTGLALISVLSWSIRWLCNHQLDRIETSLMKTSNPDAVSAYIDSKLIWLERILSQLK